MGAGGKMVTGTNSTANHRPETYRASPRRRWFSHPSPPYSGERAGVRGRSERVRGKVFFRFANRVRARVRDRLLVAVGSFRKKGVSGSFRTIALGSFRAS